MGTLQVSEDRSQLSIREALANAPLNAAPPELRHPVWRLWTLTAHLFPSPLPLAAAVGMWCRDYGLQEEEAAAILHDMLSPKSMAGFRFASDAMTFLASEAQRVIELRRKEAREAEEKRYWRDIEENARNHPAGSFREAEERRRAELGQSR